VKDTHDLGAVEIRQGRVIRIHEKVQKPPSLMANAGVYLFTQDIFDAISQTEKAPQGEHQLTDSLHLLIDRYPVACHQISYWLHLSYPWDLLPANESLLERIQPQNMGQIEKNAVIRGSVSIGKDTIVRSGSYVVGPIIIGQNCEIGPNCYIRPHTSIGDNCHIGSAVEIKNSIIMKGSRIPHHSYVGDSIIGEDSNLGAGTKIANLRLDKKAIYVSNIATQRQKLGAIIGDKVETGINACINAGTTIGNNTHIGPGAIASGIIAPNSKIF